MTSEFDRIALLKAVFGAPNADVLTGIGDDAAVLRPPSDPLVWTVDVAVEGVHFRRDLISFTDVGYRATMAAASDLAAMAARPLGLLTALVLPPTTTDDDLTAIARGQREAAEELGTSVIGGNLSRGSELSITTTALGCAARPIARVGARPGNALWLSGSVGLAAAGLRLLMRAPIDEGALSIPARTACLAWRRPRARIKEGLAVATTGLAAIDVSDGLASDLGHLASASGVEVILEGPAIVAAELAAIAAEIGADALDLALNGGEDYALVVALPADASAPGFVRIGTVGKTSGGPLVAVRLADGAIVVPDLAGFDHFSSPPGRTRAP